MFCMSSLAAALRGGSVLMLSGIGSGLTRRGRFALLVVVLPALTFAQNTNSGEIRGTVTDPSGASVPEVTVTIVNTDTGVTKDVTTNNAGIYDAVSVLPGNYQLTFVKPGFEKLVRTGITLKVGTTTVDA